MLNRFNVLCVVGDLFLESVFLAIRIAGILAFRRGRWKQQKV
jgi:hypothetical protein